MHLARDAQILVDDLRPFGFEFIDRQKILGGSGSGRPDQEDHSSQNKHAPDKKLVDFHVLPPTQDISSVI